MRPRKPVQLETSQLIPIDRLLLLVNKSKDIHWLVSYRFNQAKSRGLNFSRRKVADPSQAFQFDGECNLATDFNDPGCISLFNF